jgi:hypothetical protein
VKKKTKTKNRNGRQNEMNKEVRDVLVELLKKKSKRCGQVTIVNIPLKKQQTNWKLHTAEVLEGSRCIALGRTHAF